ncbi:hypothetical protein AB205_0124510, partial [Aquarana catesbeiana]
MNVRARAIILVLDLLCNSKGVGSRPVSLHKERAAVNGSEWNDLAQYIQWRGSSESTRKFVKILPMYTAFPALLRILKARRRAFGSCDHCDWQSPPATVPEGGACMERSLST